MSLLVCGCSAWIWVVGIALLDLWLGWFAFGFVVTGGFAVGVFGVWVL